MTTELSVASGLNDAQRVILSQRTPPDVILYRDGRGGKRLAYVTHQWVNTLLNEAFGHRWSWEVLETWMVPDGAAPLEVIVRGRLTVPTPDGGAIVKEQYGSTDVKRTRDGKVISLGDDLKAASSDAMKKAASLLGVALDLYGPRYDEYLNGDDGSTEPAGGATKAAAGHNGPVASGNAGNERQKAPESAVSATPATLERPTWRNPREAQEWAVQAGAFEHARHCANAYDKLRRAALAGENPPKSASEFFDLWHAEVLRRVAAKQAELDRIAASQA